MQSPTASPVFNLLVCGNFSEGPSYHTYRANGTADWLLIMTVGGGGRFAIDGEVRLTTVPGDLVLIKPRTQHDYRTDPATGQWELLWAHVHPRTHWLPWLNWPDVADGLRHLRLTGEVLAEVTSRFTECDALLRGARQRREELAMNTLEALVLAADGANPLSEQGDEPLDPRVRQAMDHAGRHLDQPLTMATLADVAGLSVSRFAHLFRQQAGISPQQFVEQQRIARARQLLELSSRSIKQIARDVGFDTQFYFSQRFKRAVGVGPRAYRERAAGTIRPQ